MFARSFAWDKLVLCIVCTCVVWCECVCVRGRVCVCVYMYVCACMLSKCSSYCLYHLLKIACLFGIWFQIVCVTCIKFFPPYSNSHCFAICYSFDLWMFVGIISELILVLLHCLFSLNLNSTFLCDLHQVFVSSNNNKTCFDNLLFLCVRDVCWDISKVNIYLKKYWCVWIIFNPLSLYCCNMK